MECIACPQRLALLEEDRELAALRAEPLPTLTIRGRSAPLAIAALIQATAAKLYKLHARNLGFRLYSRALIMENKWRAARYGLDGKLIDFGRETEVSERELMLEYLDFVDDVLDELDSRSEVEYVRTMLERGNGAERQLEVFEQTNDLKKVVEYMVAETAAGL